MGRSFGAPIQVWTREGRPARFLWQGRLYVIQRVLDHWVTLRAMWRPEGTHDPLPKREFWRVRAGTGPALGVYELRHDSTTGQWLLARVGE